MKVKSVAACVVPVVALGLFAAVAGGLMSAGAVPAGGYDQSVYEATGPALTAVGMAQSYSGDGRYTVFESDEKLTPDAAGDLRHVYRRTVADGSLVLVSKDVRSDQPPGASYNASVSHDGTWIAYETTDAGVFSTDPHPGGSAQIALVDMSTGTVTRVSTPKGLGPDPVTGIVPDPISGDNTNPMVSADGSHVVFSSSQAGMSDQGAASTSTQTIELYERASGHIRNVTSTVDVTSGKALAANAPSDDAVISADGRYVAFDSIATNLGIAQTDADAPDATSPRSFVYRWDSQDDNLVLVSVSDASSGAVKADDTSYLPTMSADGSKVGFISAATNLLGATDIKKSANHMTDAYVRNMGAGVTHRVSEVLVDQAQPTVPDSAGRSPSTTRSRSWVEPQVSSTRISLSADGSSAIVTSMSPLLAITGACEGCQKFADDNSGLDVYDVRLTPDALPEDVRPLSVKRTDQDMNNTDIDALVRSSSTGGGDSIADGKTPTTDDGSLVAFASQAGDLRGMAGVDQIQKSGPPLYLANTYLPIYVDGGEPDGHTEPVRTFTVASNTFNSHLHMNPSNQASLVQNPAVPVSYETRPDKLPELDAAPAQANVSGGWTTGWVAQEGLAVDNVYVTAMTSGSAEITFDTGGLLLDKELSVPSSWVRAKSDAPNQLTYTTASLTAGGTAAFSLQFKQDKTDLSKSNSVVATMNNDIEASVTSTIDVRPAPPSCVIPSSIDPVIAGVATTLFATQCRAAVPIFSSAAHGTVSVDGASGLINYTPDTAYVGPDTLTLTILGWYGRTSVPVTIPVTVTAPPAVNDDTYTITVGQALTVNSPVGLLANDRVPAGTDPHSWSIQQGATAPAHGSLALDISTGAFTFVPEAGYVGDTSFKYIVVGAGSYGGVRSSIATVTIHIGAK
ncbi:MAG: hypothetical protein JWQ64_596 [Subtercola sp.]|nr:hypothetical protein [Subtercola sp.]